MKPNIINVIGLASSMLGIGATLIDGWVSDKKLDAKIDAKVAEKIAEALKNK